MNQRKFYAALTMMAGAASVLVPVQTQAGSRVRYERAGN